MPWPISANKLKSISIRKFFQVVLKLKTKWNRFEINIESKSISNRNSFWIRFWKKAPTTLQHKFSRVPAISSINKSGCHGGTKICVEFPGLPSWFTLLKYYLSKEYLYAMNFIRILFIDTNFIRFHQPSISNVNSKEVHLSKFKLYKQNGSVISMQGVFHIKE